MSFDYNRLNNIKKNKNYYSIDLDEYKKQYEEKEKQRQQNTWRKVQEATAQMGGGSSWGDEEPEKEKSIFDLTRYVDSANVQNRFEDGYQVGDVLNTGVDVLGAGVNTVAHAFNSIVNGFSSVGTNLANAISYGIAENAKNNGDEELYNRIHTNIRNQKTVAEEIQDYLEPKSYLSKEGGQIFEGVGQSGAYVTMNAVPVVGTGLSQATMYGNALGGSLKEEFTENELNPNSNRTNGQIWLHSAGSAGIETLTENLFGIMGGKLTNGVPLDEKVTNLLAKNIKNVYGKMATRLGGTMLGEGAEEILSDVLEKKVLNPIMNKASSDDAYKYTTEINWNQVMKEAMNASLSAGITGLGTTVNGIHDVKATNNIDTAQAIREYTTALDQNAEKSYMEKSLSDMSSKQTQRDIQAQQEGYKNNNQKTYLESAKQYGIDTENQAVQALQKFGENRGLQLEYNADMFKNNNEQSIWVDDGNSRHVYINPSLDNETALQNLAVHEMYHDTIGAKAHDKLTTLIMDKLVQDPNYKANRQSVIEAYKDQLQGLNEQQANNLINEEMTSKYLGENLGNQEFVNEMVNSTERSTIEKVIDWIDNRIEQVKNIVKGDTEAEYWRKVRENITKAYNSKYQGTEGTYYNKNLEYNKQKSYNDMQIEEKRNIPINELLELQDRMGYRTDEEIASLKEYINKNGLENNPIEIMKNNDGTYSILDGNHRLLIAKEMGMQEVPVVLKENWDNILNKKASEDSIREEANAQYDESNRVNKGTDTQNVGSGNTEGMYYSDSIESQERRSTEGNARIYEEESTRKRNTSIGESESNIQNVESQEGSFNLPENVKDIKNLNEFIRKAKSVETDAYWKSQLDEASKANYVDWTRSESRLHWKRNLIQQYLDYKNSVNNPDVRYSKKSDTYDEYLKETSINKNIETTNNGKNLLAIHNLSADKLQGVLDLGGFPVPSIAITNPNIVNHSQFGDISVIFNKDTINPEYKANEVYDRDVWSPTFPQVDYVLNEDAIDEVAEELGIKSWQLNDYAEDSNNANYLAEKLLRKSVGEQIIDKYIKDNNLKYETAYKENTFKRSYNNTPEMKQFVNDNNITLEKLSTDEALMNEYLKLTELDKDSELYQNLESSLYWYAKDNIKTNLLTQLENDIKVLKGEMETNPEIDEWQTNKNKEKVAKENGIEDYLKKSVKDIFGEKGIRNDRDLFTPSGNRRSFWQLHDEYNLDNIVKALVSQDTQSSQSSFMTSFGQINAGMAQQFNSIEDIRNAQNRLKVDSENNLIDEYKDKIGDDITELSKYYKHRGDDSLGMQGFENSAQSLLDLGKSGKLTEENFRKILDENIINGDKVPTKLIDRTIEDLKNLKELPTDYFEAKPQRAVGFDEVDAIVVPSDLDSNIRKQLEDKGVRVIEYDANSDTARNDIMKALDEYKFNKKAKTFDEYLEQHSINKGTVTKIKDVLLPVRENVETKLPVNEKVVKKNTSNNNRIVENTKDFFNEDMYNELTSNKDMFEGVTESELKEGLKQLYKTQLDEELKTGNYKEDASRKRIYMQYKNAITDYNKEVVNTALDRVKANRNDRRTVSQWLEVAKQIGENSGDLSAKQIQDLAYGSWFDLKPNTKDSITRYDNVAKTNLPFQKFTSDEWVNTIYENAKQARLNTFEEALNKKEVVLPVKEEVKEVQLPTKENTQGEPVNWNEIERPEDNKKFRKHYRSIIESSNTTAEAKAVAKEIMGLDTYVPDSNKAQLERADNMIQQLGADETLNSLKLKILNNDKITSTDIAIGERLIEYYSKTGSKENLQEAIYNTALMGTQAGQTVQALAILNHQTPVGQVTWIQRSIDKANAELQEKYGKKGKEAPQFEFTSEMQDKILNTETKEEMYKAIDEVYEELGKQVPKTKMEQIDEWRYFSMLANIKTHGRNVIGNVAMHGIQRVKDKIAGGIEDVVAKFNPDMERMHTLKKVSKETKAFAKQDLQNMDVQTMLGMNENKYNPQSRLQGARITFKSDLLNKTLGKAFDFNSTALEVEDNIGLKAMYTKALGEYLTANNIDVNNITDAELAKARNYAVEASKEATFHQASSIATMLNQLGRKNAVAKFALDSAVPFKKTPINVAKTGIQYSPVGLVKSAVYDLPKLRKGQISVNQYIDNVSRGVTGTGIVFIGYALAEAGILKASGSDDDKKEKYEEEQGKQSYSIQIGDNTYSLDWLAPAGIPLFIGAEINQQFKESKEDNTEGNENDLDKIVRRVANIANASANAMNPMSEMSMISGLTSILSSYNQENALGTMLVNTGKSYVNQYVPTALGQIARTTDDYERTTKSTKTGVLEKAVDQTINQIKSKVPVLRQTLPVKTDIWGQDVKQSENLPLRAFNNFVNPSTVKEVSNDKVNQAINELYDKTGESSILPSVIDKTFTIDGTKYRMTNEEYAKYVKDYGTNAHDLLEKLVSSKDYAKLDDNQKQKAIENVYSYAKEKNKLDYAKNNGVNAKASTLYNTLESLKNKGGNVSDYLNYTAKTQGITKESEKNKILADSNYSNKTKELIYAENAGKDDNLYNNIVKNSNIDIGDYLKYKVADSEGTFEADKNEYGQSISGTSKQKRIDYINKNISGYNNRLLLIASNYKITDTEEKQKLVQWINKQPNKMDIYKQLSDNFLVQGNKVYYK